MVPARTRAAEAREALIEQREGASRCGTCRPRARTTQSAQVARVVEGTPLRRSRLRAARTFGRGAGMTPLGCMDTITVALNTTSAPVGGGETTRTAARCRALRSKHSQPRSRAAFAVAASRPRSPLTDGTTAQGAAHPRPTHRGAGSSNSFGGVYLLPPRLH